MRYIGLCIVCWLWCVQLGYAHTPASSRPVRSPLNFSNHTTWHKTFFELHQAIGHLESWMLMQYIQKKRCVEGRKRASMHIRSALSLLKVKSNPFRTVGQELHNILHAKKMQPMYRIESLRLALHVLGQKLQLPHKKIWHNDFLDCRKKK